jgi:hypothetical protein
MSKEKQRYIRVKVTNRMRLKDEKDRTIYTCEADGTQIAIKDGADVVISEYVYNNLKDAVEILYRHEKPDPNKPAILVPEEYATVDVFEIGDWMDSRDPKDAPLSGNKVKKMIKDKNKQQEKVEKA